MILKKKSETVSGRNGKREEEKQERDEEKEHVRLFLCVRRNWKRQMDQVTERQIPVSLNTEYRTLLCH